MTAETFAAVQNSQVLLLAGVLLTACLAKLLVPAPDGPAGPRGTVAVVAGAEGALALALLVSPHVSVRVATTVAFAVATWFVGELRLRRPEAGCGCFGGLSVKRVDRRSVLRAVLCTIAAATAIGAPQPGLSGLRHGTLVVALVLLAEIAVLALLSPEIKVLRDRSPLRRRPPVPCERREVPLADTLRVLHSSRVWSRHYGRLAAADPVDVWREGCWRFLAYPARSTGHAGERPGEVVFAVSTAARDRTVRAAMLVDPAT